MEPNIELKWTRDISRSLAYIEKAVGKQPILVIAYLVMSAFAGVVSGAAFFARIIGEIVFLALACDLIRSAYYDLSDDETRQKLEVRHGGAPLLSLIFLWVLYGAGVAGLGLFLMVPGIWWAVKSSLSIVFVCIEDVGAARSLNLSHQLLNDRFWLAFKYLCPVGLLTLGVTWLLGYALDSGLMQIDQLGLDWPIVVAAATIASLLKAVFFFIAQMVVFACLVRLYAFLRGDGATNS